MITLKDVEGLYGAIAVGLPSKKIYISRSTAIKLHCPHDSILWAETHEDGHIIENLYLLKRMP